MLPRAQVRMYVCVCICSYICVHMFMTIVVPLRSRVVELVHYVLQVELVEPDTVIQAQHGQHPEPILDLHLVELVLQVE